jgi:hypothetical protein
MAINRREFVKSGAAITALQTLGPRTVLASYAPTLDVTATQIDRMTFTPATWYRPNTSNVAHSLTETMWLQIDLGTVCRFESVRIPAPNPGEEIKS